MKPVFCPVAPQRRRLGGGGADGPRHRHPVGGVGVLRGGGGLRRGARRRADGLPAVLREPHAAVLGGPGRGLRPEGHRLQLPLQVHHGKRSGGRRHGNRRPVATFHMWCVRR